MCLPNDKEKGFGSGARFYMSKPFLPDDLLATVREALQWKTLLKSGAGTGTISAGANLNDSLKSINQMSTELLSRTTLPESDVNTMRQAIETLDTWTRQWNAENKSDSKLRIDYQIPAATPTNGTAPLPQVEWKLTESSPGILEQAFFKTPPSGGSAGGGLIGWGAATFLSKPIAPLTIPARWLEILSQTGAAVFEKNSKARSVAFSRQEKGPQASLANGAVPVVEVGPVPTRRKEQPVAKA